MTSPFICEMMSSSCGGVRVKSVLDIWSGAVTPGGKGAPGGSSGSAPGWPCPFIAASLLACALSAVLVVCARSGSLDQSTRSFRPMNSVSFKLRTAEEAESWSRYSAKPKPLGLPVSLSRTRRQLTTVPTRPSVSLRTSSDKPEIDRLASASRGIQATSRTIGDISDEHGPSRLRRHFVFASRTACSEELE